MHAAVSPPNTLFPSQAPATYPFYVLVPVPTSGSTWTRRQRTQNRSQSGPPSMLPLKLSSAQVSASTTIIHSASLTVPTNQTYAPSQPAISESFSSAHGPLSALLSRAGWTGILAQDGGYQELDRSTEMMMSRGISMCNPDQTSLSDNMDVDDLAFRTGSKTGLDMHSSQESSTPYLSPKAMAETTIGAEATRTMSEERSGERRYLASPPDDSGLSSNANSSAYSILPRAPVPEPALLPAAEETSSSTYGLSWTGPIAAPSISSPLTTASKEFIPGTQTPESEAAVPIPVVAAAVDPTLETAGNTDDETSAVLSTSLKRARNFLGQSDLSNDTPSTIVRFGMSMLQHELDNNVVLVSTKSVEEICVLMLEAFKWYNAHILPNRTHRTHRRVGNPCLEHLGTETHAPHSTSKIPPCPSKFIPFVRWIILWQKSGLCCVRLPSSSADVTLLCTHQQISQTCFIQSCLRHTVLEPDFTYFVWICGQCRPNQLITRNRAKTLLSSLGPSHVVKSILRQIPPVQGLRNDVVRKDARRLYYRFAIDDAVKHFSEPRDPLNAEDLKLRTRQARIRTDLASLYGARWRLVTSQSKHDPAIERPVPDRVMKKEPDDCL